MSNSNQSIKSLANLLNSDDFNKMSFSECMTFVLKDSTGSINPKMVKEELIKIFNDRGFSVEFDVWK